MSKKITLSLFLVLFFFSVAAQDSSISLNYLNLGKGKGGDWNSGVGVQMKIHLKNNFYLLPDVGYFFEQERTLYQKGSNYSKEFHQYLFVNANIGYKIDLGSSFSLVPYLVRNRIL